MENISINLENLTDEEKKQLLKLIEKGNRKKDNIFDIKKDDDYYYIDSECSVVLTTHFNYNVDIERCICNNACKSAKYMEKLALQEELNRKLWQYSWEHDGDKIDYFVAKGLWYISFDLDKKIFEVLSSTIYLRLGVPTFFTEKVADSAIKDVVIPFLNSRNIDYFDLYYTGE